MIQICNFLKQTSRSELFYINRFNEYCFRFGKLKNLSVMYLYKEYNNRFLEYLNELNDDCNVADKKIIKEIIYSIWDVN